MPLQQYELEGGIHWKRKNYTVEEERRLGAWKLECHSRGVRRRGGEKREREGRRGEIERTIVRSLFMLTGKE